jgi:transmembrane sensor
MGEKEIIELLVKKYVTNQATGKELAVFFHLLGEDKLDDELIRYMDHDMIAHLRTLHAPDAGGVPVYKRQWSWKAAAIIVMLIGVSFLIYLNRSKITGEKQQTTFAYIHTGWLEIKKIQLSDGTKIWLNSSTTLKYPEQFAGGTREIFLLEGEAYFEVKRDIRKPFIVYSAGTATKVLGTEFNIRSYNYLPTVQVTVSKGKVSVGTPQNSHPEMVTLLPNQRATFDRKAKIMFKDEVSATNTVSWKEGRLVFDNETLQDIASILAQKYNVRIRIDKNKTKEVRLTAEFEATDSFWYVISALSLANNLEYRRLPDGLVELKSKN